VAKTQGGSTPIRTLVSKPLAADTHRQPPNKKNAFVGATSNQPSVDQAMDDKKKWAADKEVVVDPDDRNKKLRLGTGLKAK
jgi:hypothetical protein